jgi:hypothetical protein
MLFPDLQRITLRAIRVPELRQGRRETLRDYKDRVYHDFKSRPLYYVKDTSFWRNEFNYLEYKEKIKQVRDDIRRYIEFGGKEAFYQSNGPSTCFGDTTGKATSTCPFLEICESGLDGERLVLLYEQRSKKKGGEK